jgi:glycosyltransferase involved in cell wall biosynthesis
MVVGPKKFRLFIQCIMDLTFVFPCLNEERSLGACIDRVRNSLLKDADLKFEVVVADNGSTDDSRLIAERHGARVVPVPERGYGAALSGGIHGALGSYVMFADADGTYLYEDALSLYHETKKADADMGIASRLKGRIEKDAMPPLHRWLGTPVLTWLINRLFGGKLSDCNSGFRCIRRESFNKWNIRASGMEFASELLIKALKHDAKSVEIPSGLTPSPVERMPHLRTWRDGMRHLLFILSERPRLFEVVGLAMLILATLLQAVASVVGPIGVGSFHIFDVHSQVLLMLGAMMGAQLYLFSCMLYLRSSDPPLGITRKLIEMEEGILFFLLLGLLVGIGAVVSWIMVQWALNRFSGLHHANELIVWVHFLAVPALSAIGLLGLHVLRKAR